ncbi:BUB3.2 [Scenedesmus sp. PABB004]|nr:BUB3.2 [Scenedesmus sp. PABB004]
MPGGGRRAAAAAVAAALLLPPLACAAAVGEHGKGGGTQQAYSCDALARVPAEQRCAFVRESCPSESAVPYARWYYCHVAHTNVVFRWAYVAAACCLLPLAFCLLGDTAEFYIAPIMAHVSQAIPKMRPRFAGVTFVALGNGAPDLSANVAAISAGEVVLSAGALTGAAMFVQCIVAAELIALAGPDGIKCGGAMLRDVGVYCLAITSVLLAFALGQGFATRDELEESLLPWALAEDEEADTFLSPAEWLPGRAGSAVRGGRASGASGLRASSGVSTELSDWAASSRRGSTPGTSLHGGSPVAGPPWGAEPAPWQPAPAAQRASHTGHAPHLLSLGSQTYVDAKTYRQLVWADLAEDEEEEARLEREIAAAALGRSRPARGGSLPGGPGTLDGSYQPPAQGALVERSASSMPTLAARQQQLDLLAAVQQQQQQEQQEQQPGEAGGTAAAGRRRDQAAVAAGAAAAAAAGGGGAAARGGAGAAAGADAWQQLQWHVTLGNSEDWAGAGAVRRTFRRVTFPLLLPAYLGQRLTIPFASDAGYSREWLIAALLCAPLGAVVYLGALTLPAVLGAAGGGVVAAAAAAALTARDAPGQLPAQGLGGPASRAAPGLLAVAGFAMGVAWIDSVAGEVVGVITFLGGLAGLPSGLMGLTLLAWGNSLGDYFGNTAMARAGHGSTAITACFAAPLFNMLMSLALGFSARLHRTRAAAVRVELTPEVALGCAFLLAYGAAIVAVGRRPGRRLPPWFAHAARAWYGLYFAASVASSFWGASAAAAACSGTAAARAGGGARAAAMAAAPAAAALGTPVAAPPSDGVTRLRWSSGGRLLATSWDETARVYDVEGVAQCSIATGIALLDGCFQDDGAAFVGGLDGSVSRLDLATQQRTAVGSHADAVKCTEWLEDKGLLATSSWDGSLCYWDPRAAPGAAAVTRVALPGRAYSLAVTRTHVIAATSGRQLAIFATDRLDAPEQPVRESSLKFQTRCVAAASGQPVFALGSVEGRVAMEVLDPDPAAQEAKYAFKCHRRNEAGVDVVFPVNAIAFHPTHGTFATGGGDGLVNVWDGAHKKRIFQTAAYPSSVSSLAFSACGGYLAVASSYCFEFGERNGGPPDEVYIRPVAEAEVKPKPRKAAAPAAEPAAAPPEPQQ